MQTRSEVQSAGNHGRQEQAMRRTRSDQERRKRGALGCVQDAPAANWQTEQVHQELTKPKQLGTPVRDLFFLIKSFKIGRPSFNLDLLQWKILPSGSLEA